MTGTEQLENFTTEVANAIRLKTGSTDAINPQDFATRISSIEGGANVDLSEYAKKSELSTVATSGNYNDLSNKPTIPDISNKQDVLVSGTNIKTINGESILGSGDITIEGGNGGNSGGGVYSEVNHGTSDTTFTLTPNTFHVWGEVTSLDLSLGDVTSGVMNEYIFQFTSGSTATTLTLPDDIKWTEDIVIESNMIYQISIVNGLGVVLSWNNEVVLELIENFASISAGGIITFTYPVASDLVIDYYGRTTGMPTNMSATITAGEQSISTGATTILRINSITPSSDRVYNYTFEMS